MSPPLLTFKRSCRMVAASHGDQNVAYFTVQICSNASLSVNSSDIWSYTGGSTSHGPNAGSAQ